jgi:hypothetical protein
MLSDTEVITGPVNKEMSSVETDGATITSNLSKVISLTDGTITETKKGNKKGRPVKHSFANRITLLKEEVEFALENGDAFIEMMTQDHKINEERMAILIQEGELLDTNFQQMFYTIQGNISEVLNEMSDIVKRWESRGASARCDFKKKKIVTKETSPLYLEDVLEVHPDIIYGYVKISYSV